MKNRNAFFYIIITLSLLVVAALVFLLAPVNDPDTPAVLLPTPSPTDSAAEGPDSFSGNQAIAVTPETVQSVIRTLDRIDCYSRTLSVRDYWSGGSRSRSIEVWSQGENLRLTVRSSNSAQEHVLLRGSEKWIWYSDAGGVFRGPAMDGDADAYQTILSYEDVLDLPSNAILDAGYTDFQGLYCIFLRYRSGSLGYESECFVDPATGLLMGERCYDGETLIYSMDSTVPDLTAPEDSVFAAP